jgi:exoribonuclease R
MSKKNTHSGDKNTKKNILSTDEKKIFMNESLDYMKKTQDKMMNEYGFGKETNRYIFYPERNRFYMYDEKTKEVFFEARFQVIGTYVKKSETWRWGWANRYVPNDLQKTSLKVKEFGEVGGIKIFSKPKVKGENLGFLFTSVGMYLSKAKGYYIIPGGYGYPDTFIVFTKVSKVDKKYKEIVKNDKNNKKKTKQKYERVVERTKKKYLKKKQNNKKAKKSKKPTKPKKSKKATKKTAKKKKKIKAVNNSFRGKLRGIFMKNK